MFQKGTSKQHFKPLLSEEDVVRNYDKTKNRRYLKESRKQLLKKNREKENPEIHKRCKTIIEKSGENKAQVNVSEWLGGVPDKIIRDKRREERDCGVSRTVTCVDECNDNHRRNIQVKESRGYDRNRQYIQTESHIDKSKDNNYRRQYEQDTVHRTVKESVERAKRASKTNYMDPSKVKVVHFDINQEVTDNVDRDVSSGKDQHPHSSRYMNSGHHQSDKPSVPVLHHQISPPKGPPPEMYTGKRQRQRDQVKRKQARAWNDVGHLPTPSDKGNKVKHYKDRFYNGDDEYTDLSRESSVHKAQIAEDRSCATTSYDQSEETKHRDNSNIKAEHAPTLNRLSKRPQLAQPTVSSRGQTVATTTKPSIPNKPLIHRANVTRQDEIKNSNKLIVNQPQPSTPPTKPPTPPPTSTPYPVPFTPYASEASDAQPTCLPPPPSPPPPPQIPKPSLWKPPATYTAPQKVIDFPTAVLQAATQMKIRNVPQPPPLPRGAAPLTSPTFRLEPLTTKRINESVIVKQPLAPISYKNISNEGFEERNNDVPQDNEIHEPNTLDRFQNNLSDIANAEIASIETDTSKVTRKPDKPLKGTVSFVVSETMFCPENTSTPQHSAASFKPFDDDVIDNDEVEHTTSAEVDRRSDRSIIRDELADRRRRIALSDTYIMNTTTFNDTTTWDTSISPILKSISVEKGQEISCTPEAVQTPNKSFSDVRQYLERDNLHELGDKLVKARELQNDPDVHALLADIRARRRKSTEEH